MIAKKFCCELLSNFSIFDTADNIELDNEAQMDKNLEESKKTAIFSEFQPFLAT